MPIKGLVIPFFLIVNILNYLPNIFSVFQVRAYIRGLDKNLASDKSDPVFCQGQGGKLAIILEPTLSPRNFTPQ